MYTIRTLNNIAKTGLAKLPEQNFVIDEKAENPEGIILRSFDMHKMELNESLLAVARAGAGTNNIPIEKCTQKGVPVFNTPGANANAVKELVLAGLFASSRRIIAGAAWVQGLKDNCENVEKAVEAGKKEFTGPEIAGKTLGVIGLGAIGVQVANAALDLGMEVIGYDPFLSLESAWHLSPNVVHEESMEELVAKADYITLHHRALHDGLPFRRPAGRPCEHHRNPSSGCIHTGIRGKLRNYGGAGNQRIPDLRQYQKFRKLPQLRGAL